MLRISGVSQYSKVVIHLVNASCSPLEHKTCLLLFVQVQLLLRPTKEVMQMYAHRDDTVLKEQMNQNFVHLEHSVTHWVS